MQCHGCLVCGTFPGRGHGGERVESIIFKLWRGESLKYEESNEGRKTAHATTQTSLPHENGAIAQCKCMHGLHQDKGRKSLAGRPCRDPVSAVITKFVE